MPTDDDLLDFLDGAGKTVEPIAPPGLWHNFGEGLGDSTMKGLASVARGAALVAPAVPELFGTGLTDEGRDWYFSHTVEPLNRIADFWTPDAKDVGSAGQLVNGLVQGLVPLAVGGGNPAPLLLTAATDTPVELVRQGVDADTAVKVGAVNTVATAVGFRVPVLGNGLVTRLATGAGGNLAVGTAAREGVGAVLDDAGHTDLAEQYRGGALDAWLDLGMGAAFGALHHATTLPQRDALLTARNAEHFQQATMPGEPATARAPLQHQQALETAIGQLLRGENVNVGDTVALDAFNLRPDLVAAAAPAAAALPPAGYAAFRRALESGGRADARNPASSAVGADQFTAGTWRRVVAQAKPAWAEGLTDAELLAARLDPEKSGEMAAALDRENAAALRAAGQPVNPLTLYAAHHFGAEKAIAFARAADDTPMAKVLTPGQIKANPYLAKLTKGETVANWTRRAQKAGVEVRSPFVQPDEAVRAAFVDRAAAFDVPADVAAQLAPRAPRDLVTGFLDARLDDVQESTLTRAIAHVRDTGEPAHYVSADLFNLGGLNAHVGNVAARANVHYRALAQALDEELRATGGDVVPMRTGGDEFGAVVVNADAAAVQAAVDRAHARIAEYTAREGLAEIPHGKRQGEKGVGLHVGTAEIRPDRPVGAILERADLGVNQSKLKGTAHVAGSPSQAPRPGAPGERPAGAAGGDRAPDRGTRPDGTGGRRESDGHAPRPVAEGRSRPVADGTRSPGSDAGTSPADPILAEAQTALAENPDLQVMDADGNVLSAADFLAQGEAARAEAAREAEAIQAVVTCALRNPA